MPTYDDLQAKLSGLHFSQETLSRGEREILHLAEAMLKQCVAALLAATQEVERLRRDNERLDGVTKALAGSHARLREENEALSPLRSLLDDWRWADMDQYDIQDNDLARRIVEALAATERELAAIRLAAGLGEG